MKDKQKHQQNRLADLNQALRDKAVIKEQMKVIKEALRNGEQKLIDIGPSKAQDWLEYAKECVQPGIEYARKKLLMLM